MNALHVDPADAVPLWRQIEEGMRRLVAAGALLPGAVVPSVRDLAKDLRVNPATVAKAYQRLVDEGVLAVRRGEGTYVAEEPPGITRAARAKAIEDAATRYAVVATSLGAKVNEAVAEVKEALARLQEGKR